MRVLITIAPLMYRQTLSLALRKLRPNAEIILAAPDDQDAEVERISPHLVVCNEVTNKVLSSETSWMEVLYTDGLKATANVGGRESVVEDAGIDFLLANLDRAQELIPES